MGRSIPVSLGGRTFPSKKAAKDELTRIRKLYRRGEVITDEDHIRTLLDLVCRHPQAEEKIGSGIVGFYVDKSPDWPTECFYLVRSDGSRTEFSYPEALAPTSAISRLRGACRAAIKDQKLAFKDQDWPPSDKESRICPITDERYGRDEAHVDHEPPQTLKTLVNAWLLQEGLKVDDVPVHHTGDGRSEDELADETHLKSWRAFHQGRAVLRMTSKRGNLLQGSRELGP